MKYEVAITFRKQLNYLVEIPDSDLSEDDLENRQKAEDLARDRYVTGDQGDNLGNEWEDVESLKAKKL